MALRHTAGLTLLIAVAAAVVALPSPQAERSGKLDELQLRLSAANTRLRHASEFLRREHSRTLAAAALVQSAKQPGSLVFVRAPGATDAYEQEVRRIAERDLLSVPQHDAHVRTIIVMAVDTGAAVAGAPSTTNGTDIMSVDVFPPGTLANDACVAVTRAHLAELLRSWRNGRNYTRLRSGVIVEDRARRWPTEFGACQWYAAYGVPGRGISTWLDSTHFTPIHARGDYWPPGQVRVANGSGGYRYVWAATDPSRLAIAACADGRFAVCDGLLLSNPAGGIRTSGWTGKGRAYSPANNLDAATLLERLSVEMGAEQFGEFWKSDLPLPEAFHKIRGGSLTKWIREQAISTPARQAHERSSVSGETLIALLVAIAAPLLLAIHAVFRRSGFA